MPSATLLSQPKIAIIGAGPVSLTLGCILQKHSIPFTIYEAYTSIRTQGGSLDLHPPTGQAALKEAGLWDAFMKHARPESDVKKIVTLDGEVMWDENENGPDWREVSEEEKYSNRPEIDRTALQNLLSDYLEQGRIVLGKKLQEVIPSVEGEGKYDLHFADREREVGFDLVVGADGAWSKVRPLLSNTKPEYSGISMISFWCRDINKDAWLLDYAGAGSMMAFGEGCAVISQRQGDGSLLTYAGLRVPEDFIQTCGIDWNDADAARKQFVERYLSHVSPDLQRVVLSCPHDITPRPLYELPVGFNWTHRAGITLVGDAAHVFTPFAGEGVNLGMKDALSLAQQIVRAVQGEAPLDDTIQAYEQDMFVRSEKAARKTMMGKLNHFSETGSKDFAGKLKAHHQGQ